MFKPLPPREESGAPNGRVVIFNDREVVVSVAEDGTHTLPRVADLDFVIDNHMVSGELEGEICGVVYVNGDLPTGKNLAVVEVRIALLSLNRYHAIAMGRGRELYFWRQSSRFCGKCGAPMVANGEDSGVRCTSCRNMAFPVLAPAVIVAILRGKEILLAHNSRWQDGLYGILAGFVEAGESAEDAIMREIKEEVNIEVKNIRYYGSQCWPLPNSLMFGYVCEYASGEIEVDGKEIVDAKWFSVDDMPMTPPAGSIAHEIINAYKAGELYV